LSNSNIKFENSTVWVFIGVRNERDFIWEPKYSNICLNYFPVVSRPSSKWRGHKGYIQDVILDLRINLADSEVYACGSSEMIDSSRIIFEKNGLDKRKFLSDAFVQTN
jgi:CDP-4-dehydro-6-deoxyglucose reductase